MLPHDTLDLRALDERRRDHLREAREDRRAFSLQTRERRMADAARVVSPGDSRPAAGITLGAALCRGVGRKLESAGRALQIMGNRLETRPGRAGELPAGP